MKVLGRLILAGLFLGSAHGASASSISDLGTVVISSTRVEQKGYKVAGNISVLTQEYIKNSSAQTVPDLLKEALGVHMSDNSTSKSSIIDIRGFGDTAARNVLVLVDGRKINSIDVSGPDIIQVPLESVERIEVIRGAGSVLYGDNAVGGVVNIITKEGQGDFHGQVGAKYGSYDAHSTDFNVSGEKNNIHYYLFSKYDDKRGYRDNTDLLAKDFNTRLGYDFNDRVSADVAVGWHEDTQELPAGLTAAQLDTLGPQATVTPDNVAYTKDRFIKFNLDVNPWPEGWDYGRIVLEPYYRNRDVYDEFNESAPFFLLHTKRNIDTRGITGKYVFDSTILDHEVNFVTGIDFADTDNDILGSGSGTDDITITKRDIGFYGFSEFEVFNKVFANVGTRYQKASYGFHQHNVLFDEDKSPEEWVSMGGMKYEYAKGSTLHWTVQQTFRFLATDEWYSSAIPPTYSSPGLYLDLQQQTGIQYEVGVKHNFNDKALVSLTPYWIDLNHEIYFDPVLFTNSNYDKTRRVGFELEGRFDLLSFFENLRSNRLNGLEFFSNYTYQNARFVNGANDDKYIPMVPQHQANSGITVKFFERFRFSVLGHYIGSSFVINDPANATSSAKPYYVLDTRLAYERKLWEVYGEVNNVTNEHYSSYVSKSAFSANRSYFPAPGTNYMMGMKIKF